MSRIAAILPAAGMGTRMGAETPKQFLELDGIPIVILSLRRIAACPQVTDIIVATRADEVAAGGADQRGKIQAGGARGEGRRFAAGLSGCGAARGGERDGNRAGARCRAAVRNARTNRAGN